MHTIINQIYIDIWYHFWQAILKLFRLVTCVIWHISLPNLVEEILSKDAFICIDPRNASHGRTYWSYAHLDIDRRTAKLHEINSSKNDFVSNINSPVITGQAIIDLGSQKIVFPRNYIINFRFIHKSRTLLTHFL